MASNIHSSLEKQRKYLSNLNKEEIEAIKEYTGSGYESLNRKLREKERDFNKEEIKLKETLDRIFEFVPPIEMPLVLYRGIKEKFRSDAFSYISTTYDLNVAISRDFRGSTCCLLRITISVGSKILPLEFLSEAKYEKEILLHRTGKFQITSISYAGDLYDRVDMYDLVYVPSTTEEIKTLDIKTLKNEAKRIEDEEWVSRIVNLATREEIEILGAEDFVETVFEKENLSKKIKEEAIKQIKVKY